MGNQPALSNENLGSKIRQALIEMIQYHSKSSLENYMQIESELITIKPRDMPIYGHWLTLILLSAENMHIIVKTHFDTDTLVPILKKVLQNQNLETKFSFVESYMNEFSNLLGTKIKNTLHDIDIPTGMSLPLLTRGFDNFFFEENFQVINRQTHNVNESDFHHIDDVWCLKINKHYLFVSVEVDIMSHQTFNNLTALLEWKPENENDEPSSQLEFL